MELFLLIYFCLIVARRNKTARYTKAEYEALRKQSLRTHVGELEHPRARSDTRR